MLCLGGAFVFSHSSLPESSSGQGSGEMPVWPKPSLGWHARKIIK